MDWYIELYFSTLIFLLGLVLGSFLNCMAMRVLRQEDFVHGRSHCMHCAHVLGPLDLIPVLSYLLSRGRCRYCGEKISIRYPLSELVFAGLLLGLYLRLGLTPALLQAMLLTGVLFCISLTDLEDYTIPDEFLFAAILFFFLTSLYSPRDLLLHHELPMLFFGGGILYLSQIMDDILKKESMGGGDIKLIGVLALYLGWLSSLFLLFLSSLLGLCATALLRKRRIPFGPFLSIAAYLMLLYGPEIVSWYLSIMI